MNMDNKNEKYICVVILCQVELNGLFFVLICSKRNSNYCDCKLRKFTVVTSSTIYNRRSVLK